MSEGCVCFYLCSRPATAAWGTWFPTVALEERGPTGARHTSIWLLQPKLTPSLKSPAACPGSSL